MQSGEKKSEFVNVDLKKQNQRLHNQDLETLGILAGGIAHDFNNILATISGYAEIIKDDLPDDSQFSENVAKILAAVDRARSLTNKILSFNTPDFQEKMPVNSAKTLKETVDFIKSALPQNIKISSEIPDLDVNVLSDPVQLFRVFVNLLTNAIQAMKEKGGILSVKLSLEDGRMLKKKNRKEEELADIYVQITISDTGTGMDPSQIKRIFEPYYTARDTGAGTGLGLSIVYGIVSEMEGKIIVSSKKNKGSVFNVYLPVIGRNFSKFVD